MRITLYKNTSEFNYAVKSLELITTMTGSLREPTSITSPEILIESESREIFNSNYIWIEDFNRFYFVRTISSIRTGLWKLSCHVDVLSTYWPQIRNIQAVIARQENLYNLYLADDRLLVNTPRVRHVMSFDARVPPATSGTVKSFILTVAGGGTSEST